MIERRHLLGLGLAAGAGAVVRHAVAQEPAAGYASSPIHRAHPLEFRLDSGYRPDLSDAAARTLVRAVRDFLDAEHPDGLSITFWDLPPARMPFLDGHLERLVEHLFRGIAASAGVRPVDPILVLALLYNESRFHPTVISPAGAAGIAQFMPDTAREYGLAPTARPDLWSAFREARAAHRQSRDERQRAFRARHGDVPYTAEAVIDRAVATRSLDVLAEYRALRDQKDPSEEALAAYIRALKEDFAELDFFGGGREALEALDARIGYRPIIETVRYLARALRDFQGLTSSAVAAYNAGPDAVRVSDPRSILHRYGDLPYYRETVRYVQRFLAVYSSIKFRLHRIRAASGVEP